MPVEIRTWAPIYRAAEIPKNNRRSFDSVPLSGTSLRMTASSLQDFISLKLA